MSLEQHIRNVFTVLKPKRGWTTIYWMVDVHGVILPGSWQKQNKFKFLNAQAKFVLRWISNNPDQRLILWTSSKDTEIKEIVKWLKDKHSICVDYVNENPEEKNTDYADFSKKPYFNILLDDKAGFNPHTDWLGIKMTLMQLGLFRTPL